MTSSYRLSVLLSTILLFLYSTNIIAQSNIDSLTNQYLIHKNERQLDSALFIAQRIEEKSFLEHGDSSKQYASALYLVGDAFFNLRQPKESWEYLDLSSEIFENKYPLDPDYASCLNLKGILKFYQKDFDLAELFILRSLIWISS